MRLPERLISIDVAEKKWRRRFNCRSVEISVSTTCFGAVTCFRDMSAVTLKGRHIGNSIQSLDQLATGHSSMITMVFMRAQFTNVNTAAKLCEISSGRLPNSAELLSAFVLWSENCDHLKNDVQFSTAGG
jgi:hypothetical protein